MRQSPRFVADTNHENSRHKSCRRLSWFVSKTKSADHRASSEAPTRAARTPPSWAWTLSNRPERCTCIQSQVANIFVANISTCRDGLRPWLSWYVSATSPRKSFGESRHNGIWALPFQPIWVYSQSKDTKQHYLYIYWLHHRVQQNIQVTFNIRCTTTKQTRRTVRPWLWPWFKCAVSLWSVSGVGCSSPSRRYSKRPLWYVASATPDLRLLRATACDSFARLSHRRGVRPSVCHTPVLCQHNAS